MKELSIEEKAARYDKAIEKLHNLHDDYDTVSTLIDIKEELEQIFPELKESEDERIIHWIRKELEAKYVVDNIVNNEIADKALAWLEKQGELSIYNTPAREVILAIWSLGNEWKELTHGSISTEYGTQLEYIQKHWQESDYYPEKQGEKKVRDNLS